MEQRIVAFEKEDETLLSSLIDRPDIIDGVAINSNNSSTLSLETQSDRIDAVAEGNINSAQLLQHETANQPSWHAESRLVLEEVLEQAGEDGAALLDWLLDESPREGASRFGDPTDDAGLATAERAITELQNAVEACRELRGKYEAEAARCVRLEREAKQAAQGLAVRDARLDEQEQEVERLERARAERDEAIEGLRRRVARLGASNEQKRARLEAGVDEVRVARGFELERKTLEGRAKQLEWRVEALEKEVAAGRALVESNHLAHRKQRAELRQARRDRAEYEVRRLRDRWEFLFDPI